MNKTVMESFALFQEGYGKFREKYANGDQSVMEALYTHGQSPHTLIVACCDSRVDPALLFQCDPGDIFVVRNVANIVPPYEQDQGYHGTSAALEFGIRYLKVQHLVVLGHSQCGGIQAFHHGADPSRDDFISKWVSTLDLCKHEGSKDIDGAAKRAVQRSCANALTFPWIQKGIDEGSLTLSGWFFDIKRGVLQVHDPRTGGFVDCDGASS